MTGGAGANLDQPIDPDDLEGLRQVGPITFAGTRAKLFTAPPRSHPPDWEPLVRNVFGDDADIPSVAGASSVMVVERKRGDKFFYLAFTFGGGWRLLRPDSFHRGFGLKACLNIVFEGDTGSGDWDPARLRSVDSKRVGTNILRARHQVSGQAALEDLDVNARRDLVNGVTGIPQNRDTWGTRITGRDALQFSRASLDALGEICDQVLNASAGKDYEHRFKFIDDFVGVTDPITRTRLEVEVIAMLESEDTTTLDLAAPVLVDWEQIGGFQYHTERLGHRVTRYELRLDQYLTTLRSKGRLTDLTPDGLRSWAIWAVDGSGSDVTKWSVWRCLFGEIALDGETYVLDDGDFYQVSKEYLKRLDAEIDQIPEATIDLVPWDPLWKEDAYNDALSTSSPDYLLLDRKTVRVESHTNQVEICDVLTKDKGFIHVKRRGDGSASLSHLFNQGFVSADLTIGSKEFRKVALEKISKQEKERAESTGDDTFLGRFQPFDEAAAVATECEIVFAIHPEPGKGGAKLLPFFSKVTLRNMVDELSRRGFRVSIKEIEPTP
jgi:uncharacterized protein (TIGR04141 family)